MFRLLFIIPLAVLLACQPAHTQDFKKLDNYIEQTMKTWNVPGLAIVIVKDTTIFYMKGYGYSDLANKKEVSTKTIFPIGSSTKSFTGFSVCQAASEGLLDLDTPVKSYLPDFQLWDSATTTEITPKDLLIHNSGLPRHDFVWFETEKTREEIYQNLKYLQPNKPFRKAFQYQNLMYMTAGYMVGRLAGTSWETYVSDHIFKPLEMNSSQFEISKSKASPDYAKPYEIINGKVEETLFSTLDEIGPAGSINSNVEDMSKWLIMQLNKGVYRNKRIISEELLEISHTPYMDVPWYPATKYYSTKKYALGWFYSTYREHKRLEHGGNISGFSAACGILPDDGIGVVVLTNLHITDVRDIIRDYAFDFILGLEEVDWSTLYAEYKKGTSKKKEEKTEEKEIVKKKENYSLDLASYLGTYEHPAYGIYKIELRNDSLWGIFHGFEMWIEHDNKDVFKSHNRIEPIKPFHFIIENDKVSGFKCAIEPEVDPVTFVKH